MGLKYPIILLDKVVLFIKKLDDLRYIFVTLIE